MQRTQTANKSSRSFQNPARPPPITITMQDSLLLGQMAICTSVSATAVRKATRKTTGKKQICSMVKYCGSTSRTAFHPTRFQPATPSSTATAMPRKPGHGACEIHGASHSTGRRETSTSAMLDKIFMRRLTFSRRVLRGDRIMAGESWKAPIITTCHRDSPIFRH